MDKTADIERIKEIEKQQTFFDELFVEDIPKKKKYTLRMDITFNKELTQEDAEKVIHSALHSAGVIAHRGGIS